MITQGRSDDDQWITTLKAFSIRNGSDLTSINLGSTLTAYSDRNTQVENEFSELIIAKSIQINPTACSDSCGLRLELYFKELEII